MLFVTGVAGEGAGAAAVPAADQSKDVMTAERDLAKL